jgi:DNA-binding transcriptional regulator PaaX
MQCEGTSFFVENLLARCFHLSEWMLNANASAVAFEEGNLEQKVTKEVASLMFFVARLLLLHVCQM